LLVCVFVFLCFLNLFRSVSGSPLLSLSLSLSHAEGDSYITCSTPVPRSLSLSYSLSYSRNGSVQRPKASFCYKTCHAQLTVQRVAEDANSPHLLVIFNSGKFFLE
jgi:hypothetical protein